MTKGPPPPSLRWGTKVAVKEEAGTKPYILKAPLLTWLPE